MAFQGNTMKQDIFFHILRFLHFNDNKNEHDETNKNYDRLWKMRAIVDKVTDAYAKYYTLTEHRIKIYKLCDSK
jgi:hypothetical protein